MKGNSAAREARLDKPRGQTRGVPPRRFLAVAEDRCCGGRGHGKSKLPIAAQIAQRLPSKD